MKIRALFCLSVSCFAGLALASSASAATIKSQASCTSVNGYCLQFSAPGDTIPLVRSIGFNAPGAGTAAVSFHGSLVCSNSGSTADKVVDLVTQIVPNKSVAPVVGGAGALRLAAVLKDSVDHSLNTSDAFNLASTRVFTIPAAGARSYFFKIAALRMDAGLTCYVYSPTFTVLFVP